MRSFSSEFIYRLESMSKKARGGMNPEINEVILRSKPNREPMSDERLHMLLNYAAGIIAEVLGFALAFVIVLAMAGVFR